MNSVLKNLYDLFSDDKKAVYQALSKKKDLILDKFYLYLNNDEATISMLEKGYLPFNKLLINPKNLASNLDYESIFNKFNDRFRVLYFFHHLEENNPPEDQIIVKVDFSKLDSIFYQMLYPNFYKTIDDSEIYIDSDDNISLITLSLNNLLGDYVLILDSNFANQKFYLPYVKKIIFPKNTNGEIISSLRRKLKNVELIK